MFKDASDSLQCLDYTIPLNLFITVLLQLKALAALRGIFKEHSVDELAAILLTWVRASRLLIL